MMKHILITGGSGMVGKNLRERLDKDTELTSFSPSSQEMNLLDFDATSAVIKKHEPDLIIHCAGKVGGINANIADPVNFLFQNLEMGKNIVMAAKQNGVSNLLNLGSSCMYPKDSDTYLKENEILSGVLEPTNEGYALAKITIAKLCEYMSKQHEALNFKTIIPPNLYGKWDKFDEKISHLVPAVIKKVHRAKVEKSPIVTIWGSGSAKREFMFASDLADFIHFAIFNFQKLPSLMNVGIGTDHTIKEYYEIVSEVIGYEGKFDHDLSKPEGMKRKLLDISQQEELGWIPQTALKDGIAQTYNFYLENSK